MNFITDKQTTNDLELFEKNKGEKSVFSFYNQTNSKGGAEKLKNIFSSPINNIEILEKRINALKYFEASPDFIDIDKQQLDFIEFYLIQDKKPTKLSLFDIFRKALDTRINPTNISYVVNRGIYYLVETLNNLYDFANSIDINSSPEQVLLYKETILDLINTSAIKEVLPLKNKKIGFIEKGKLDYYFRYSEAEKVKKLLDIIYEVDAFKSISSTIQRYGFTYPTYNKSEICINIKGLFHPFIENPVSNDANLTYSKNLCFLTGPNMAGKSTYLKSFGISVYLAHIGFPVPAKSMETFVFNGMFSSINLSDNINKGYSHYYNEVLRVKNIAVQINQLKNTVVIFDELFRGTNVKDAYDASLAVIQAFAKINNSIFAISTHIIEVADKLKHINGIDFKYFEIKIKEETPEYTYILKSGVTDERIGMYILEKEKVIETIENSIETT